MRIDDARAQNPTTVAGTVDDHSDLAGDAKKTFKDAKT
jgi:hypothetical protein